MPAPSLELIGLSKSYPGVLAVDRVSLRVNPGQIHAVLGENGAGKSTLMKMIYGAAQPDEGEIRWNGQAVNIKSPAQARVLGIGMVFQHFSLFDTLTAAENVWLGLDKGTTLPQVTRRIRDVAAQYGLEVDPLRPVHTLSVGERQRVEIVRALMAKPKLLILDEPTSVLTPQAVDRLFGMLRKLATQGCGILYISHKLDEIRALCSHCTVLRAGRVTGEVDPSRQSNADLSRLMIGSQPPLVRSSGSPPGGIALAVRGLSVPPANAFGTRLDDVSFTVSSGEILGIAGVSGNGQQELMAALSGEDARRLGGRVRFFGRAIGDWSTRSRRRAGLHFVPEERLGRGAVPQLSLQANTLLTRTDAVGRRGWISPSRIKALAQSLIERFNIKAAGPHATAKSLSGGNLQKFIVGREIDAGPRLLIVSQPTWGVDVGASSQIRAELLKLRDEGCALLIVSEELDELFEIADRLVVMSRGRMSPDVATARATAGQIGEWMSGLWPEATESGLETEPARA